MIRLHPFPHLVLDNWIGPAELAAINASWPGDIWSGWHKYKAPWHWKRASDLTTPLPGPAAAVLTHLADVDVRAFGMHDLVADLGLYGAGLHEIGPGGRVGLHLDAEEHPRLHLRRSLSGLIYVHQRWEPEWGGALLLGQDAQVRIEPVPGRLVLFDCRQEAWHAVEKVLCPAGRSRRALAMFWYAPASDSPRRTRAHFAESP
jgi:hypothetical protein